MYYHANQSLNNMLKAEKEGYDACIIGCSLDVGMDVIREMLSIPVVAIGHAILTAEIFMDCQCLGEHRFGAIQIAAVLI